MMRRVKGYDRLIYIQVYTMSQEGYIRTWRDDDREKAEAATAERRVMVGEVIRLMRERGVTVFTAADCDAFLGIAELEHVPTFGHDQTGQTTDNRIKLYAIFERSQPGTVMMTGGQGVTIYWKGSDSVLRTVYISPDEMKRLGVGPAEMYRNMKLYGNLFMLPAYGDALRGYSIADADETMESRAFYYFAHNADRFILQPKLEELRKQRGHDEFAGTGL